MTILSREMRARKLAKLVELEGFESETALFEAAVTDSVCPAICVNPDNPDCDYTAEMEPDQAQGRCEACERGTVVSALVLGGAHLMNAERIRELNDHFRTTMSGGKVLMTAGINALPAEVKATVIQRVTTFSDFNADNNPHGEHDFGNFMLADRKFFWKIDAYDTEMRFGSEDPADPAKTTRVLTIMLAEEY